MARVKRGKSHLKRRKSILKQAKGYMWGRKNLIKLAKTAITKAGAYAYRDRRNKKREFRKLWNIKINAGLYNEDMNYSKFIHALKKANVTLNRKMLAELAEHHPQAFKAVVDSVK